MKKRKVLKIIPLLVILMLASAFFLYTGTYYHAEPSALEALSSDEKVTVSETAFGWFFDGSSRDKALIFYPGGKVEETAYAPLLHQLAQQGVDVFLVSMPFRLAVLAGNKADEVIAAYDYPHWFIAGHSLGGAMAAIYAAEHPEPEGVILLAAYPTRQLEEGDLELTIYGDQDGLLNREKIQAGRQYASGKAYEWVIPGGNHCQFGNYGFQKGDGEAAISALQQQSLTVDYIIRYISNN